MGNGASVRGKISPEKSVREKTVLGAEIAGVASGVVMIGVVMIGVGGNVQRVGGKDVAVVGTGIRNVPAVRKRNGASVRLGVSLVVEIRGGANQIGVETTRDHVAADEAVAAVGGVSVRAARRLLPLQPKRWMISGVRRRKFLRW